MPAIDIPDPLPPAITPLDRIVIEFLIDQHLEELGDTGLVASTWHWSYTEARPGRSATWTGPRSTATSRHQRPPSPRKSPPASRPWAPAHPVGRTQQGQVHLLAMHFRPRRRSATAVPPLGRRASTCRHQGRVGHRDHA